MQKFSFPKTKRQFEPIFLQVQRSEATSKTLPNSNWLALLDDFRKFDWAEEYKYPTVILAQMNQLLAECRDDQPALP